MLTLITSLALVIPQAEKQEPPAKPAMTKEASQLAEVCKKVKDSKNFTFQVTTLDEGGFQDGQEFKIDGRFSKGLPIELKEGKDVVYRDGQRVLHRVGDKKWEAYDFEAAFGGGGGGDREEMMVMFNFQAALFPHKALGGFADKVTGIKREEKEGKVVYSGKLSTKGADEFSGAARMRGFMERFGSDADIDASGTFKLTATADGIVEGFSFVTTMSADMGGRAVDVKRNTTVKLTAMGKTELKVPNEVLACLEL